MFVAKKVNLWEISLVTFGANPKARITSVKSLLKEAKTVRDVEHILRDAGFSATEAKYLISLVKGDSKQGMPNPILESLKSLNAEISAYKIFN